MTPGELVYLQEDNTDFTLIPPQRRKQYLNPFNAVIALKWKHQPLIIKSKYSVIDEYCYKTGSCLLVWRRR